MQKLRSEHYQRGRRQEGREGEREGEREVSHIPFPLYSLMAGHIQDLGKGKLGIMKECKEFKKGIHMLEW